MMEPGRHRAKGKHAAKSHFGGVCFSWMLMKGLAVRHEDSKCNGGDRRLHIQGRYAAGGAPA